MYLIARADPGLLRLQGVRKRADLKNKEVECFKDLSAINNSISQTMTRLTMWQGTWNGTAEIRMQRIALLTSWDSMDYSFLQKNLQQHWESQLEKTLGKGEECQKRLSALYR